MTTIISDHGYPLIWFGGAGGTGDIVTPETIAEPRTKAGRALYAEIMQLGKRGTIRAVDNADICAIENEAALLDALSPVAVEPPRIERLVTALGTHFLKDGSPCFCSRWDAVYGNGDVVHQPRCRMGRMALGFSGEPRTVGCAAGPGECKGFPATATPEAPASLDAALDVERLARAIYYADPLTAINPREPDSLTRARAIADHYSEGKEDDPE